MNRCPTCRKWWVVDSLRRDCERAGHVPEKENPR